MFSRIRIRGLGPHTDTEIALDPDGVTELHGPSEAGKSTITEALTFVLWGLGRDGKRFDVRAIRDGSEEIRVDLTFRSGTVLSRSLQISPTGRRTTARWRSKNGEVTSYATEDEWTEALAGLGQTIPVLHQVLVPRAWVALAQGTGGGRPLRDMLDEALPTAGSKDEIIREIMAKAGHDFRDGDPTTEKDAAELRTQTNREIRRVEGKITGLEAMIERLSMAPQAAIPEPSEVEAAQAVIAAEAEWAAGDADRRDSNERNREIKAAQARYQLWKDKRAEIGDRPEDTIGTEAIERAWADRDDARAKVEDLRDKLRDLRDPPPIADIDPRYQLDIDAADSETLSARAALEQATDVCPCCRRDGWDGAVGAAEAALRAAEEQADAARQALTDAEAEVERRREERAHWISELDHERAILLSAIQSAEVYLRTQEERLQSALAERDPVRAWERQIRALGDAPTVPLAVPLPPEPAVARPTEQEVRDARALLERAKAAEIASEEQAKAIRSATEEMRSAEADLEALSADSDYLDALVAACRAEPSESVRRQLGALGDLGPVSIELGAKGGAAVLIDDRPWHLASSGRQVVADVWLRAGLRRAVGVALPLVVDDSQAVAGQELPTPAPAIVLRTTEDSNLKGTNQ